MTDQPANYARIIRFFTLGMLGVLMVATVVITIASQVTPN